MNEQTVIIGGGIIGLAIAVVLRQRGVDVLLLDAGDPGMGASWGNAGHIAAEQVFPVADASMLPKLPAMLLDPLGPLRIDWRYLPKLAPWGWQALRNMLPARARRSHQALRAINGQSMAAWQRLAASTGLAGCLKAQGTMLCCETEAAEAQLRQQAGLLNRIGVQAEWLDDRALHEREPALSGRLRAALLFTGSGQVLDPRMVTLGLLQALADLGGRVQAHCRVHEARAEGSGFCLQTAAGEIRADRVVLAAGAFSAGLARALTGVRVPLDTERGYHLMLPQERARVTTPLGSAERRFVMTPMAGGLRLAGTVEYAGLQAPPNMARARNLLPLANAMLREPLNADGATEWMGFRPTTADSLPVIDREGGVLLAFGHHHLGLTQAAATAELVAALYFDQPPAIDPSPYRVRRFA